MRDFRPRIFDASLTLRSIWRGVDCEEAHFHRLISGKIPCSRDMAIRIESASDGLIRAWELLGLPDGPAPVVPGTPNGHGEAA